MKSNVYHKSILAKQLQLLRESKEFNLGYIQSISMISKKHKAHSLAHNKKAIEAVENLLKYI